MKLILLRNAQQRQKLTNSLTKLIDEMSMSWNISQISRDIILRGAYPLCESEQSGV